jgi:hypothetical protein
VTKEILAVDWDQVRFRRAFSGLVAILVALVFIVIAPTVTLVVIIATLFNVAAANDGPMSQRWIAMAEFSVAGAIIGGLAIWSFESALGIAVVLGVVTYLGTLMAAFGQREARAGLFLTLWAVIAMILGSADTDPWAVSGAFIGGGVIAMGITALRLRFSEEDAADDEDASIAEIAPEDLAPEGSALTRLRWASRGRMGTFAVLRTLAVVLSSLVGFWIAPDYAYWAPITVIIVVKPSPSETASIAVQRTLGTALGALVAVAAVQQLPDIVAYAVIGFVVSAFFMVAFMNANYTLFAAFLTSTLVFAMRLAQADAFEAGIDRILATLAGAVISLVIVVVATQLHDRTANAQS